MAIFSLIGQYFFTRRLPDVRSGVAATRERAISAAAATTRRVTKTYETGRERYYRRKREKAEEKKEIVRVVRKRLKDIKKFDVEKKYEGIKREAAEAVPSIYDITVEGRKFRKEHPEAAERIYSGALAATIALRKTVKWVDKPSVKSIEAQRERYAHIAPPEELRRKEELPTVGPLERTLTDIGEASVQKYKEYEEKPVEIATEAAMLAAGGYVFGAATKVGILGTKYGIRTVGGRISGRVPGAISPTVTKATGLAEKAVEPVTGLGFGGYMLYDIGTTPVEKVHEKLYHYGVGLYGASKGFGLPERMIGRFRTRGMTEIPIETIVEPKVLSGEKWLPELKKGETFKEFTSRFHEEMLPSEVGIPGYRGWRGISDPARMPQPTGFKGVTGKVKGELEFQIGEKWVSKRDPLGGKRHETDMPGAYVSPSSLSPHFVGLGRGKPSPYDVPARDIPLLARLFGTSGSIKPSILRVEAHGLKRIPEPIVKKGIEPSQLFIEKTADPGYFYTSRAVELKFMGTRGGKKEIEAVLPGRSLIELTGKQYYTTVMGTKVPIREYKALEFQRLPEVSKRLRKETGKLEVIEKKYRYEASVSAI